MKLALDTNVLVYAEGWGDAARCERARSLVARLNPADVLLPMQVLGELHRVLTGKARRAVTDVRSAVLSWSDTFGCIDTSLHVMQSAQDLVADHQLSIWDALVMSAAASAGCRWLLSEDFQHEFTWGGVTVINPFQPSVPPLLEQMFGD